MSATDGKPETRPLLPEGTPPEKQQQVLMSLLNDLQEAKGRIEEQAAALKQANEQLKLASQMKDEFVAKVSHELRTPLTSIKEGLSLVLDGALGQTTAEQRDFLKTMDGDIDRLTELINNILDIAKIEAGRMRLMRDRLDLGQLISSMIRSYQPIIGGRRIATVLDGVPAVFGDAHRILQVFTNLFANALKFTADSGSITFRGRLENGMVAVSVEDDGSGIAQQDIPKLFHKFSQVGHSGPQRARGTGLGLTVCKELTELHQGTIVADSILGKGSTFTVKLPVYTDFLALQEGLQDTIRSASQAGGEVALLAVHAAAAQPLEKLKEQVRANVHRDDLVITRAPDWVVVMAVADHDGLCAMGGRLRGVLGGGTGAVVMGGAVCAEKGADAGKLFERATSPEGLALFKDE